MAHNSSNIILLKEALSTLNIDSCPSKINLHSHTTYSDGSLEPEDIIQQALDNDLEHFSVTDHHSIQSVNIISTWLNKNESYRSSLNFWPGIEISSLLNGCLVHILGIGIDVQSTLLKPYILGVSPIGSGFHNFFQVMLQSSTSIFFH